MKMQNSFMMGIQARRDSEGKVRDAGKKENLPYLMDNTFFHHRNLNEKGGENVVFSST